MILFHDASSIVTAIFPFADISGNPISAAFARGIPDELAYVLMRTERCTVISPLSAACLTTHGADIAVTMKKAGAQIAFEGSARSEGTKLRITARIIDATGVQLWVKRIDVEVEADTSFAVEEDVATALAAGFEAVRALKLTAFTCTSSHS